MDTAAALADDLLSADAVRDPYEMLGRLRAVDPVHWSARHRAWILTRYDDVAVALADDRLSTDNIRPLYERMAPGDRLRSEPAARLLEGWMLFNDPPVHTALRAPVRTAFTPRATERLRSRLAAEIDGLLDRLAGQGDGDLVPALARPLPALAIAELLGVPASARPELERWSRALGVLVVGKVTDETVWDKALAAAEGFASLFGELIAHYECHPADNLITALIAARDSGDSLSPSQLVGACTMLLFAGHETTGNQIANGVLALLRHPEARERLRRRPELLESAVEEMVRFDGPGKVIVRRVREPHVLHGREFEPGQPVFLAVAAANRDPAVFADPDRFDVARDPNRHLGFGWSRHFCLGAQLARLETGLAVGRLFSRFPGLALGCDPADLRWQANIVGRSLLALPVALGSPA